MYDLSWPMKISTWGFPADALDASKDAQWPEQARTVENVDEPAAGSFKVTFMGMITRERER